MKKLLLSIMIYCFVIVSNLPAQTSIFDTPSEDQWQYWINLSLGSRDTGPVFFADQSVFPGIFNFRDGINIYRWDTSTLIPSGQLPNYYNVESCKITIYNIAQATWNPTGNNTLGIPNRIELFGVGYGPTYNAASWTETTAYIGGQVGDNQALRDPYPRHYLSGDHVENNTETSNIAWALGNPIGYTPGAMTAPFPVEFELNITEATALNYIKQGLADGRMDWMIATSILGTTGGGVGDNPNFVMKEGLIANPGAMAPSLEITLGSNVTSVAEWSNYR